MNWMRLKRAAEHVGERAHGQRLGQAGHALEQHVAAGEQRDEQPLEHRVLADDDALDLVEDLLERLARLGRLGSSSGGGGGTGRRFGHVPEARPATEPMVKPLARIPWERALRCAGRRHRR